MADVASDSFHHKSPLDTLVRQSSTRAQAPTPLKPASSLTHNERSHTLNRTPSSPLLHTRFRASASTASTTFTDLRGEDEGNITDRSQHLSWAGDGDSIYSDTTASEAYVVDRVGDQSQTLPNTVPERDRQSWAHDSTATVQMDESIPSGRDTRWSGSDVIDPFSFRQYESPTPSPVPVPMVVVSSPSMHTSTPHEPHEGPSQTMTSRSSATQYNISNFSRPIRYPSARHDQSKQKVLERNRSPLPSPGQQQRYQEVSLQGDRAMQSTNQQQNYYNNASSLAPPSRSPSPSTVDWTEPRTPAISRSRSANTIPSNPPEPVLSSKTRSASPNSVPGPSNQPSTPQNAIPGPLDHPIRLPTSPPSPRPTSRASLYSAYSYYQLDDGSRTPSPSSPHTEQPDSSHHDAVSAPSTSTHPRSATPLIKQPPSDPTPDDFLLLGIQHHEANRLTESAICFERSATMNGGCGIGMLMWGLSLRHAWGTSKDEKAAFRWLRRAAEAAVGDLESARNGIDQKAIKSELVLAIYEVGQCFFHGWGVAHDKKMAVSYFQVAARLGDCEAQQEMGYCLANGKGCKKNLKEAAKWYRAAAAQGASTVGLAWIYKSKYL